MADKPSLVEQAHLDAIAQAKAEKPDQFTIDAYVDSRGNARAAATYDRKLTNLWGLTAYARAYWNDVAVTPHPRFDGVIGAELTRKFEPPK